LGEQFTCKTSEGGFHYKITAVIEDVPKNSYLDFDCLLSYHSLVRIASSAANEWGWNSFNTFVKLRANSNLDVVNKKLKDVVTKYKLSEDNYTRVFTLQPIHSIHLHSNIRHEIGRRGNAFMIYILMILAIFILLIAWINYVNVSTAKSKKQILELHVQRVLGCSGKQLFYGQLLETFLLNFMALVVSMVVIQIITPLLNMVYHIELHSISFKYWSMVIGFTFFIALLSGIYPALLMTVNNGMLANRFISSGRRTSFSRNSLVVIQFVISIVFIITTLLVVKQLKYIRDEQDSLAIDHVVTIKTVTNNSNLENPQDVFVDEAKKMPGVEKISVSTTIPGGDFTNAIGAVRPVAKKAEDGIKCFFIDSNETFFDLYHIDILAGANFKKENAGNKDDIIINETAAVMMGYEHPADAINQTLVLGEADGRTKTIKGVVKDYHQKSVQDPIEPTIYTYQKYGNFISVKYHNELNNTIVERLKVLWNKAFPDQPFEYQFNDEYYFAQYTNDVLFGKLISTFSLVIIFIACIGLYSLSRFSINARIKEIGIRKVNGATVSELIIMLTSGFLRWVVIALLIACPIGWYIANKWLNNFAYHTKISWWIFLVAGVVAIIIAVTTLLTQTWKAANRNPVEALRYE
jgi:putative ABC transport system permease protein